MLSSDPSGISAIKVPLGSHWVLGSSKSVLFLYRDAKRQYREVFLFATINFKTEFLFLLRLVYVPCLK